jgi:fructokinase
MCVNLTVCYAPERIILGGGAMQQAVLPTMIREQYIKLMNGYMQHVTSATVDDFIVISKMQGNSATRGALILAAKALTHD